MRAAYNRDCLNFPELPHTSLISISPPTAFPLVHLVLQLMFCLPHPYLLQLQALPAGPGVMKLGGEESYRQRVDGPVNASAVLMFDPLTP